MSMLNRLLKADKLCKMKLLVKHLPCHYCPGEELMSGMTPKL